MGSSSGGGGGGGGGWGRAAQNYVPSAGLVFVFFNFIIFSNRNRKG